MSLNSILRHSALALMPLTRSSLCFETAASGQKKWGEQLTSKKTNNKAKNASQLNYGGSQTFLEAVVSSLHSIDLGSNRTPFLHHFDLEVIVEPLPYHSDLGIHCGTSPPSLESGH